jgi:hypothetical protein
MRKRIEQMLNTQQETDRRTEIFRQTEIIMQTETAANHASDHSSMHLDREFASLSISNRKKYLRIFWDKDTRTYTLYLLKNPNDNTLTSFQSKDVREIAGKIDEFMTTFRHESAAVAV